MKEEEPQKWIVSDEEDFVHVVPDWDIQPHADVLKAVMGEVTLADEDCPCKPIVKTENQHGKPIKTMIIHNSFLQKKKIKESVKKIVS